MNLRRNITTTLSARILTMGLALVSSIVLARFLGPEGRGILVLVLLLPELAVSFGLLGFQDASCVFAGLEPQHRRELVWHSVLNAVVLGGAISLGMALFVAAGAPRVPWLVRAPRWLYYLALTTIPAQFLVTYWSSVLRGMNQILISNLVEVGNKLGSIILILVLVVGLRLGVEGAVWAEVIFNLLMVMITAWLLRHTGAWGRPALNWGLWGRMGKFAVPAYFGSILGYVNYRMDQIIIAAMLPPEELGYYVLAVGLAERLWLPTSAVATVLLPHLTNSEKKDPELPAIACRHVMIWTGLACVMTFFLAPVLIPLLYSSAFSAAVAPMRWILPGIFGLSIGKVLFADVLARKKTNVTAWIMVVVASVNLGMNLLLVPRMGISGASLASSVSYCVLTLIVVWYYLRVSGVPLKAMFPTRRDLLSYQVLWKRSPAAVAQGPM